jgi:hypothetical protein
MLRMATNYITIAANANEQKFAFTTNDDNRTRHVKSVFVGITTKGVKVGLYLNGRNMTECDCTRFAAGDPVVRVEFDVPSNAQFQIAFTDDTSAGSILVPVVIGYDLDAGSGP